ncbi:hypothetical protein PVAP13_9NG438300 [Panicum virgatum]|uniref:Uncharacterized protein n=1 Tax=Panicum virgatum TaxID=38727 RepID=A0A8T0MQC7_PANVG|nr:hypothetical protein PVAP13_9NG438300 [Panicum virgatum]
MLRQAVMGGCRHLPRNGNTAMGVAAALYPLASMSTNSLGGISWCFQESAPGIDTHGDRKQPLLGAWRAAQRCFDLMGYRASMRPSLIQIIERSTTDLYSRVQKE